MSTATLHALAERRGKRLACDNEDPELMFAESEADIEEAKQVCRRCPLREECLEGALETDERWGVWGGLDPDERGKVKADRRRREASVLRKHRRYTNVPDVPLPGVAV